MMHARLIFLLIAIAAAGCAPSGEVLRFRANFPPIDDAFRKLSIALTLDGYTIERSDPAGREVETGWRPVQERAPSASGNPPGPRDARIAIALAPRGQMYDVFVKITIREGSAGGTGTHPVSIDDPLAKKWRGVVKGLLVEEKPDED